MRKNPIFSRIDHFRSPRTRFLAFGWKKVDSVPRVKNLDFCVFFVILLLFQIAVAFSSGGVGKWSGRQKTGFFLNFNDIFFSIFFEIFLTGFRLETLIFDFFHLKIHKKIPNPASVSISQNWVKSGQNRPKFKNSENWEKM